MSNFIPAIDDLTFHAHETCYEDRIGVVMPPAIEIATLFEPYGARRGR